ncbi:MAG: family 1 encapsulin nanocompartment shell protein [Candidatus Limiplasma sp.]|nr:family 1 encapsulin nanocompartment shell protein [Candidatus Limiplasma sp.]
MDFLARNSAALSEALWQQVDDVTVRTARAVLTGRRILPMVGPLGAGATVAAIDDVSQKGEWAADGLLTSTGRTLKEIPTLYEDFTLYARDLAAAEKSGQAADLSAVAAAAQAIALKEDRLLFLGNAARGYEGLLSAEGVQKVAKSDWAAGENAFADVSAAIEAMVSAGVFGAYTLVLSPALHTQLQRLQPGTGLLEAERIAKLVDGRLFKSPVLGREQAVLLCAQPENMDLVVGQDLAAAYLEQKELNHSMRLLETVLLRLKRRQAVVVFG